MIFCTSTALKVTFVPPAQAITGCAASPTFFALSWHKISISKCRIYSLNVPKKLLKFTKNDIQEEHHQRSCIFNT